MKQEAYLDIGATCRLRGSGVAMCVVGLGSMNGIEYRKCSWLTEGGDSFTDDFPVDCLEYVVDFSAME